MSQTPIPFSSSFRSLTLNVTTGTPPNQVTHTQAITSVYEGNNSVPITDAGILNAFNSQAAGTSFTPSIVAEFGNALKTVSTPSVASFIPRVISLANIPNKLTTDAPFSLSSLITTVSAGVLSYSSSVTSVATVNSSGQVTPVGAGTTTITVTQSATANHRAASASRTFTVSLPPPPISLAANGVTIQYTGVAGDVPNNMPRFIEANPRGTGNEWFAVVNDSSKTQITSYAKNEQSGISYFTTSGHLVPFNNIVTTLMTDMSYMFRFTTFNQPLNAWDVSNVTTMSFMFDNARAFNQPLNLWDVSAVTNMNIMFRDCRAFDQPLNLWNTAAVINMGAMFQDTPFNQPIGAWNTAAVTDMGYIFANAATFNQPIGAWNTGAVTNMSRMFAGAAAFNQNISEWDVALTLARPSLTRNNFADNSPLALPENSHKLPPFV